MQKSCVAFVHVQMRSRVTLTYQRNKGTSRHSLKDYQQESSQQVYFSRISFTCFWITKREDTVQGEDVRPFDFLRLRGRSAKTSTAAEKEAYETRLHQISFLSSNFSS